MTKLEFYLYLRGLKVIKFSHICEGAKLTRPALFYIMQKLDKVLIEFDKKPDTINSRMAAKLLNKLPLEHFYEKLESLKDFPKELK